ncbi:MAG: TMEM43 family protein [Candidatus Aureabacteria bacterium]|nr:TMEM43 family protein [Candidatus Auribacterota bacterium]
MSQDSFSEVTQESWFGRIGGSIKGIVVGLVLFAVSFPLLFWNEGRAVKRYNTLKEGAGAVISVSSRSVTPGNSGKLVHMTGKAETKEILSDPAFGVSANALKLSRLVEMYQWEEKKESKKQKKLGGGAETTTTYNYNKAWSDRQISSAEFKYPENHENPASMPYTPSRWIAELVHLEAFRLPWSLVREINDFTPLVMESDASLPEGLRGKARVYNGGFYIGNDPATARIGDMRISFKVVKPMEVSIIARQVDDTFEPYTTKAGGTIELLQTGVHSAEEMIHAAERSNQVLTWILRLVGFLLMSVGLAMVFSPLSVIADLLPILGSIVGAGTGIISFLVAAILSLVTIGIAWVVYRPLLGIILLAVAFGLTVVVRSKLRKSKPAA